MSKTIRYLRETQDYYNMAHEGSCKIDYPGMQILFAFSKKAKKILDLGCGEGTRLNLVAGNSKQAFGVDLSKTAIKRAQVNYPMLNFKEANLNNLPFKDESFDLVYSAFVLEHLDNPAKMINESIRVTEKGGRIVFIAPNYGAPNRASPPLKGSRIQKLLAGFIEDIVRLFKPSNGLDWKKIKPITTLEYYVPDGDTTAEPYLGSLLRFLARKKLVIKISSSLWSEELPKARLYQRIFRFLGEMGIYPFKFWGPHFIVVVKK